MKEGPLHFFICAFVFVFSFAATAPPVFAQSQALNGQIEGIVLDKNNAGVPRATVTATNIETSATRTVMTDESGFYGIPLLPLGSYRISVDATGFKRLVREGISLATGQSAIVNLPLEPGDVNVSVTVSGDTAIADAGKTDLGRVLNNRETRNLPLLFPNPYHLGRLQANVNGRWNRGPAGFTLFNANGYARRVNYQIDGNANTSGTNRFLLMSDTYVNEVQLITNGFAAEFGNTPGMIMNVVTPSGGNEFTGALGYRFRRPSFYTRPFLYSATDVANSKADDFTATMSAPVIKDRWHFYVGFEHIKRDDNSSADRLVTITPENRIRLIAAGLSPSIFPAFHPASERAAYYILRSDAQLNDQNRVAVRYSHADVKGTNFPRAGLNTLERGTDFFIQDHAAAVQLVSGTAQNLNEFRFQYAQRYGSGPGRRNQYSGTGPSITITGVAMFGSPTGIDTIFPTNRIIQFQDNFTRIAGRHVAKFGGGLTVHKGTERATISAMYTFSSIDQYIRARKGDPNSYTQYSETFGDPSSPYAAAFWTFFAQDDWKVNQRLKINYGVRYDLYQIPKADPSSLFAASRHFNVDKNNFAPRFGMVYTLRGGDHPTIVRGGAGIYYDAPLLAIYRRAVQNNGNPRLRTVSFTPASPNHPLFPNTFSGSLPPGSILPPLDIDAVAPDFVNMYALHSNVQVEQAITSDLSVAIGYVHSSGRHIPVYRSINQVFPLRFLADGRPVFGPERVDPRFNIIQLVEAAGNSRYDALNLQLTQRVSHGVQFGAHYTLSKATDDAPEQNLSNAPGPGGFIQSDPTDRSRDKGRSFADQRHTFIMSLVARSQINFRSKRFRFLVNNNQLGIVASANSGETFNIISGTDLNRDGVLTSDRPLGIKRNAGTTPSQVNVDLRYSRFIKITERSRFEAFAEFQNIFNINSIVQYNNVIVDTDPFTGMLIGTLPDFRARDQSTSQESRQFQLGLKIRF